MPVWSTHALVYTDMQSQCRSHEEHDNPHAQHTWGVAVPASTQTASKKTKAPTDSLTDQELETKAPSKATTEEHSVPAAGEKETVASLHPTPYAADGVEPFDSFAASMAQQALPAFERMYQQQAVTHKSLGDLMALLQQYHVQQEMLASQQRMLASMSGCTDETKSGVMRQFQEQMATMARMAAARSQQ